jgi:N,N'-diacetyllegionaminate synthase
MINLIAETAWHHEGDFSFMKDLVEKICTDSDVNTIKMHITLDLDEYMCVDHDAYETLKSWMFDEVQWSELIGIIRSYGKDLMLLLNDTKAVQFAAKFNPEIIEVHSVCLNVPRLQKSILEYIPNSTKIVVGVGGCTLEEISKAVEVFTDRETILMFGFQNYPTKYEDVNLRKLRKIQAIYSNKKFGYADHTAWDEGNNELVTLLVSANNMDYVEKHVTTRYGQQRCDYSAAISIDQLNGLAKKIRVLDNICGGGSLQLNEAEQSYSVYGPMKMAAIAKCKLKKGDILSMSKIHFCRTSQITSMSQINMLESEGLRLTKDIKAGQIIDWDQLDKK